MAIKDIVVDQPLNVKNLETNVPRTESYYPFENILTPREIITYMDGVELQAAIILPDIFDYEDGYFRGEQMVSNISRKKIIQDDELLSSDTIMVSTSVDFLARAKLLNKRAFDNVQIKGLDEIERRMVKLEEEYEQGSPDPNQHTRYLLSYKIFTGKHPTKALHLLHLRYPEYAKFLATSLWSYDLLGVEYLETAAYLKMLEPERYSNYDFTKTALYKWGLELLLEDIKNSPRSEYIIISFAAYLKVLAAKDIEVSEGRIKVSLPPPSQTVPDSPPIPEERSF